MMFEIARDFLVGAMLPRRHMPSASLALLKREDDVAGGRIEEIDSCSQPDRETHVARRLHLSNYHHFAVTEHGKMARLTSSVSHLPHKRTRVGKQAMERMVPVRDFKQLKSEEIMLIRRNLADVSAMLQTNQHAKNLAHRSSQAAGNFAGNEAIGFRGKKLEDVQAFVERRCRIADGQPCAQAGCLTP